MHLLKLNNFTSQSVVKILSEVICFITTGALRLKSLIALDRFLKLFNFYIFSTQLNHIYYDFVIGQFLINFKNLKKILKKNEKKNDLSLVFKYVISHTNCLIKTNQHIFDFVTLNIPNPYLPKTSQFIMQ